MKPIDFERRFQLFALEWIKKHPGLKEEEIDESYNDMLRQWRETPADWLDGETPAAYFDKFTDAGELVGLISAYDAAKIELPEPLYSRIMSLGEKSVPALTALAEDAAQSQTVRATALSLLTDSGSSAPVEMCVRLLAVAEEGDEVTEAAIRLVGQCGMKSVPALLEGFETATEYGKDAFLDILCNFPGDPRIYELAVHKFLNEPDKRALYATYLAKLGDPRAVDALKRVAEMTDLTYYDYLEIVNAIEALGGEVDHVREFYGDPDYEAMRFL